MKRSIRFEVFKRDAFTCQYCGAKAPEVVLEVDHIKPKSKGGENDILNYITSCFDCNRGKGKKELNDQTVLLKQRKQMEELNERRLQIEAMKKWRDECMDIENEEVKYATTEYQIKTDNTLTDHGKESVRKLVKRYGLEYTIECLKLATTQYGECDAKYLFDKWKKICYWKKKYEDKPYMKELFYIRGIINNRFDPNIAQWKILKVLQCAYEEKQIRIEHLTEWAKTYKSYWQFQKAIFEIPDINE